MSKTLLQVTPQWMTLGIIKKMETSYPALIPWTPNGLTLDLNYYGNHSGDKTISPLVKKMLNSDGVLTETALGQLAGVLVALYSEQWKRKYDILSAQYNLLENYDRYETNSSEGTNTGTVSRQSTGNNTGSTTASNQQSIYGYDSSEATPDNEAEGSTSSSETSTGSETMTNDLADTTAFESHIHGNVGVTTAQQMMTQELEFWSGFTFFEEVYKDIDKVLTIDVYSD